MIRTIDTTTINESSVELEEIQDMEELSFSQQADYPFDMYSSHSSIYDDDEKVPVHSRGFVKWVHKFPKSLWEYYKCKKVTIGVYETSTTPLGRIRKAITGNLTSCRVGTSDEDLFFVVNWATGLKGRQTPMKLYFDSPTDFEKHCFVVVSEEIKTKWWDKLETKCNRNSKRNPVAIETVH